MSEIKTLVGHAIDKLRELPEASVQMCVTSPPYFGLRDYQVPPSQWEEVAYVPMPGLVQIVVPAMSCCLGQEATPEAYVGHLVAVAREIRRVIRSDGTCWINIGDSYASAWPCSRINEMGNASLENGKREARPPRMPSGLKEKDLIGIPWRVAFALQADGWFLRNDIVWSKPNPTPQSVTDRAATSHEYVFMLAKQKHYYFDSEAVREASTSGASDIKKMIEAKERISAKHLDTDPGDCAAANPRSNLGKKRAVGQPGSHNLRSVWSITVVPYSGSHTAVFPPRLAEIPIRAGTSEHGCCSNCGAPYRRIIQKGDPDREHQKLCGSDAEGQYTGQAIKDYAAAKAQNASEVKARILAGLCFRKTVGWEPICECDLAGKFKPGDFDVMKTPLGNVEAPDPTAVEGRAGFNRPRREDEGTRPILRFQQRAYASQLRASPHLAEMQAEAGEAFAHYIRLDSNSARPVPPTLLSAWIERGWLQNVDAPARQPYPVAPCTVVDVFAGSGTVGQVCNALGRNAVLIELNEAYKPLIDERVIKPLPKRKT